MKTLTLALLSTSLLVSSCGAENQTSAVKVTNGIEVQQKEYPAVVRLDLYKTFSGGICTGTFVNDHQVVTAAHCVQGSPRIYTNRVKALSYVFQSSYDMKEKQGVNHFDLAIVNFPAGTSQSFRAITEAPPLEKDTVEIVGYGNNIIQKGTAGGISGSGSGKLRAGVNTLAGTVDGMHALVGVRQAGYELEGEVVPLGQLSATGSGDSGGPLFFEGKLAGVTSGGGVGESEEGLQYAISFFTNLNSEESQRFLLEHLD